MQTAEGWLKWADGISTGVSRWTCRLQHTSSWVSTVLSVQCSCRESVCVNMYTNCILFCVLKFLFLHLLLHLIPQVLRPPAVWLRPARRCVRPSACPSLCCSACSLCCSCWSWISPSNLHRLHISAFKLRCCSPDPEALWVIKRCQKENLIYKQVIDLLNAIRQMPLPLCPWSWLHAVLT